MALIFPHLVKDGKTLRNLVNESSPYTAVQLQNLQETNEISPITLLADMYGYNRILRCFVRGIIWYHIVDDELIVHLLDDSGALLDCELNSGIIAGNTFYQIEISPYGSIITTKYALRRNYVLSTIRHYRSASPIFALTDDNQAMEISWINGILEETPIDIAPALELLKDLNIDIRYWDAPTSKLIKLIADEIAKEESPVTACFALSRNFSIATTSGFSVYITDGECELLNVIRQPMKSPVIQIYCAVLLCEDGSIWKYRVKNSLIEVERVDTLENPLQLSSNFRKQPV